MTTTYHSVRQLIGRLECRNDGTYVIAYDLLDGERIQVRAQGDDAPYIPSPFPRRPLAIPPWHGPEKRLRPAIFWAALHLASPDDQGRPRSVLVSVTQGIGGYADDLLSLLDRWWQGEQLPPFFEYRQSPADADLWVRCLRSCEDYFGRSSREYRLLQRGIVIHHGKMPGLMARLLVRVIERRIARLVIATSTLTEGVNLPFETILIPTLRRSGGTLTAREVRNLSGRSGRPGVSTEGRTLVALEAGANSNAQNTYQSLIAAMRRDRTTISQGTSGSPLAALLVAIEARWRDIGDNPDAFLDWLESVAPQRFRGSNIEPEWENAIELVDTLDGVLLAGIEETDRLADSEIQTASVEDRLRRIWSRTYARYASEDEHRLQHLFVRRGQALVTSIYPQARVRRRLYHTGMVPRQGGYLLDAYPAIRARLEEGRDYAVWSNEQRFEYIRDVVNQITAIPMFSLGDRAGRQQVRWQDVGRVPYSG